MKLNKNDYTVEAAAVLTVKHSTKPSRTWNMLSTISSAICIWSKNLSDALIFTHEQIHPFYVLIP